METHFIQSAYALRICIADTDRGSVRMEMYTYASCVNMVGKSLSRVKIFHIPKTVISIKIENCSDTFIAISFVLNITYIYFSYYFSLFLPLINLICQVYKWKLFLLSWGFYSSHRSRDKIWRP